MLFPVFWFTHHPVYPKTTQRQGRPASTLRLPEYKGDEKVMGDGAGAQALIRSCRLPSELPVCLFVSPFVAGVVTRKAVATEMRHPQTL